MKLGLCTQITNDKAAEDAGFDFIEPTVAELLPGKPDADFAKVRESIAGANLKPEAFNCFIPGELKITGPNVDLDALEEYVTVVCRRAAEVGAGVIVFGSGGARGVPEGFPFDQAMGQVGEFLQAIAPIAEAKGITITVEPLCTRECNIINLVKEGYELAGRANHAAIRALADLYHVGQENEPYENIIAGNELLAHVHIAHPVTRMCPLPDDGFDYSSFFRALQQADYDGRISVESAWEDLAAQGPVVVEHLKAEWEKA
jgi:D-psicose/D-tagatose/L-ribulose 3-epimerase